MEVELRKFTEVEGRKGENIYWSQAADSIICYRVSFWSFLYVCFHLMINKFKWDWTVSQGSHFHRACMLSGDAHRCGGVAGNWWSRPGSR